MPRSYNPWTSAALLRLRKFYPTMTREKLAVEFAPHDLDAIKRMASRLKVRRRGKWQMIAETYTPVIFTP